MRQKITMDFLNGLAALENALCMKFGLSYLTDRADISAEDIMKLTWEIKENPDKYLYEDDENGEST